MRRISWILRSLPHPERGQLLTSETRLASRTAWLCTPRGHTWRPARSRAAPSLLRAPCPSQAQSWAARALRLPRWIREKCAPPPRAAPYSAPPHPHSHRACLQPRRLRAPRAEAGSRALFPRGPALGARVRLRRPCIVAEPPAPRSAAPPRAQPLTHAKRGEGSREHLRRQGPGHDVGASAIERAPCVLSPIHSLLLRRRGLPPRRVHPCRVHPCRVHPRRRPEVGDPDPRFDLADQRRHLRCCLHLSQVLG